MELDPPYRQALGAIDGIRSFRAIAAQASTHDMRLRVRTAAGDHELLVQQFRTHLSHQMADRIVAEAERSRAPVLILAPHIGSGLAHKFTAHRINYLDAHGNCHIVVGSLHVHIEGKTAPAQSTADKGLRSAGYQVLFTYLAEPASIDAPIRAVADRAGVSRQPVSDMRRRLLEQDYLLELRSKTTWRPDRQRDALNLWLHGYETTVRPALLWGTYRSQDADPGQLENRLEASLEKGHVPDYRWGGSAAGFRLTGHYRGERTVVHVHATPSDLPARLRALADPQGNLVLMDAFGTINWEPGAETVHPLLVYSEMLHDPNERAREAAQVLFEARVGPALGLAS